MLGGLIAGALGGASQGIASLADQFMKEAEDAKKRAYEQGLLEWKAGRDDARVEREAELRQGNTVLEAQLRGELVDKQIKAQKEINKDDNDTKIKVSQDAKSISDASNVKLVINDLQSAVKREQDTLNSMRKGLLDGTTDKAEFEQQQSALVAAKGALAAARIKYDLVSPEEYALELKQYGLSPEKAAKFAREASSINPKFDALYDLFGVRENGKNSSAPAKGLISSEAGQSVNGTDQAAVKGAYNSQLKKAMADIQNKMRAVSNDPAALSELNNQYAALQQKLR